MNRVEDLRESDVGTNALFHVRIVYKMSPQHLPHPRILPSPAHPGDVQHALHFKYERDYKLEEKQVLLLFTTRNHPSERDCRFQL